MISPQRKAFWKTVLNRYRYNFLTFNMQAVDTINSILGYEIQDLDSAFHMFGAYQISS